MLAFVPIILAVVGCASAHITGLAPFVGAFTATNTSTFPLTFVTTNQRTSSWDWTGSVGVRPANVSAQPASLGTWLANIDFVALDKDITSIGNFTVDIPLTTAAVPSAGSYVLNVAVIASFDQNAMTEIRFFNLTIPLEAQSTPADAAVPSVRARGVPIPVWNRRTRRA